jgi:hypothetical protein
MSEAALPSDALDEPKVVSRTTHLLTASWIVHWLGLFVYGLPFKLFLKNHFHLDAVKVAPLLFLAGLPFTIKPIFAWIGDTIAIGGYRRRSWTVIGGCLGAAFFLVALLGIDSPKFYVSCIFLAVSGYVFVSCSLGGLMVEFGTRNGVLGVLSSFRGAINQGVNVLVGPLAGFLAKQWIGWTWSVCAACAVRRSNGVAANRCFDGGNVDLPHFHHRLKRAFRYVAALGHRVGQDAGCDLP